MAENTQLSDVPLPGSSPLQLLKKGAYIAGPEDFNRLYPYEVFVLEVLHIYVQSLNIWLNVHSEESPSSNKQPMCAGRPHNSRRRASAVQAVCQVRPFFNGEWN